jgi:hypothetical protein
MLRSYLRSERRSGWLGAVHVNVPFGATAYGPELNLLPPKKKQTNYLYTIFLSRPVDLPAVACVLTRVLPISNGFLHV